MKRLTRLVVVCACVLVPTAVRADDGGWIEWLFRLDPKLVGVGTDFHLLCLDESGKAMRHCEELFKIPRLIFGKPTESIAFDDIRHEIDFRFGYYWKYGERFSDVPDRRSIHALKLMGMYHYHFSRSLELGGGAGYIPFFGDGFTLFSRGIVTPVSLVWAPSMDGFWGKTLFVRAEESYITQGLNGADFGNPVTSYANNGEWNFSVAAGFDFRRSPHTR